MISTTLFFLFSSFSLVMLALGLWFKSPAVTIAGGFTFLFTGLGLLAGGMQEYDGSHNATQTFNASSNVTEIAETANYSLKKDLFTEAWGLLYLLTGLVGFYLGATIPRAERG